MPTNTAATDFTGTVFNISSQSKAPKSNSVLSVIRYYSVKLFFGEIIYPDISGEKVYSVYL